MAIAFDTPELLLRRDDAESGPSANHGLEARCRRVDSPSDTRIGVPLAVVNSCSRVDLAGRVGLGRRRLAEQHLLGQTIVKPTALGPVANTDTKLLIYSLFQKGRVLAQDGVSNLWRLTGRRLLGRCARERSDQFEIGEPEGATATPRPASRAHGPWA